MKKSYLQKLIQYMKKTFKIEDKLKQLKDTRINPRYSTAEGILPVLLGFLLRMQSFNELKYRLKSNDFKGILSRKVKLSQIDTIREVLKKIDVTGLRDIATSIVKKAKQNKVLKGGTIDGYTVAAVDGTKLFGSNKKSCLECCKTKLKNGKVHHAHHGVFMSLVGSYPRLVVNFELYKGSSDNSKKDEGELTVARSIAKKLGMMRKEVVK